MNNFSSNIIKKIVSFKIILFLTQSTDQNISYSELCTLGLTELVARDHNERCQNISLKLGNNSNYKAPQWLFELPITRSTDKSGTRMSSKSSLQQSE